ncbi:hypothetical protein EHQ58_01695 [Leptospira ognonensis]|uniref:Uncharacterized protein n=1 Tax=Leptospira ognonensis TaxID=2484945 RepID=A0A4V3JS37_9LEPT|nr:hypothetical protein [Leptospira ognonensis]TGL63180.1 hypothetical protein EHQ58_01695 [Leptospira ognonensis]
MQIKDLKSLNHQLQNLEGKNKKGEVYVDNLHSPYIKFSEEFVIPASSITKPEFSAIVDFVQILVKFIPEAIEGTSLLPEPRPKKETGKLFFVRPILFEDKKFMYVFSTDMQYLGGAKPEEIKKAAAQNLSPSVISDRIYFQAKVFPVESFIEEGDQVSDFQSVRFQGGVFRIESDREAENKPRKFSEIFDELDFSDLESKIREELGINSEIWPMGRVYSPIGIDYLALSMRFLKPSLPKIMREFRKYYRILSPGTEGVSPEITKAYHQYLFKHETSRTLSRSGNMLWKIHFTEFNDARE